MNYLIENTPEITEWLRSKYPNLFHNPQDKIIRIQMSEDGRRVEHINGSYTRDTYSGVQAVACFGPLVWLSNLEELKQKLNMKDKIPYVVINRNETLAKFILDLVKPTRGITNLSNKHHLSEAWCIIPDGPRILHCTIKFYEEHPNEYEQITLDELVKRYSKPTQIEAKLNNNYTAFVHKYGVTVGCQTFSLDKIDELVKAKEELSKQ